ncbi:biotin transporter BioY [Orlajensenia leifsoniae]|uniref:Biotin transporter n=1 Tax=Orlajensenia leifsoniae TaxID=2561933 RepID=A0A4Y9QRF9_9MICO|nr:biotin transporter BioY [Leifsonia flava]TFV95119.1 biotin transporter BioY [Leifsonia flava]
MASARISARDLAQIAVFAALIAALTLPGAIPTGALGLPITLQTLGVLLAGAIIGPKKGTLAVVVYVALGAIGLPIYAGGTGGLGILFGPTGGFLFGFILCAFVVGWLTARLLPRYPFWPALGLTAVGGILSVYLIGIPWLAVTTGTPIGAVALGMVAFLPGDLIKVLVTVSVAKAVHRAWPGLITPRPWGRRRDGSSTDATTAAVDA